MPKRFVFSVFLALAGTLSALAEPAAPATSLARLPVKEVTVFKDGHAFVLHEGNMPTDSNGNVLMDYLPTPIMGAFWPYSADSRARLQAVSAKQRRVLVERTALQLRDLIEANPSAQVSVVESDGPSYTAQIVGITTRSSEENERTNPANADDRLPDKGNVLLLKTAEGTAAVGIDRIKTITFKDTYKTTIANEEFRNLLTLRLNWSGGQPARSADVGMIYVQKGIRWIPSYKISIDGKGSAKVTLQATLVNEMTDLQDVRANLVIGVPNFAFQDTVDPISLQQTAAQLGQYFDGAGRMNFGLSNAIMSQVGGAGFGGAYAPSGRPQEPGPEVTGGERNEDLFVFTVEHVTMKKGERLVLPIAEYDLKYKDIYVLDLPFAPPPEIRGSINTNQQAEIARLMAAPKVMHRIRLTNQKKHPLTTAPALILSGNKVLGQSMMQYTPLGSDVDLPLTTAVDISVKKTDTEVKRTPNAAQWQNDSYGRIDLEGTISLKNQKDKAVEVEITRHVLGNVGTADHGGRAEMVNVFEDRSFVPDQGYPTWWGWYSWPYWWSHFNGIGRIVWNVTMAPGEEVKLGYTWHYFWR